MNTATTHNAMTFRDATMAPLRKLSVDLIKTYKHINEVRPLLFVSLYGSRVPFECYVTFFSWKFDTLMLPRTANNVDGYTFVMFSMEI